MASRVQCDGCRRWMASTSSVAGYGPKCARKRGLTVSRRCALPATPAVPVRAAEPGDDQDTLFELREVANV